ncbi:MAG TPA: BtpA/SgcQ family protein, partial [Acidimicrobiales bacterium]|nr:BtpA/SgcQ family protein [Acidimicrobiales bacterium]
MSRFHQIFPGVAKPLIAMAHVPPLPGTPLFDHVEGVEGLIDHVKRDVDHLVAGGFDAVMFCNEGDRPYQLHAGLEAAAVMTRVATECRPGDQPFGVDFLWDAQCALAIAVGSGAAFMREVVTGSWESDMGAWSPDAALLMRSRRNFGRDDLAIFANVTPEFASSTGSRTPAQIAASTVVSSLVDAILVSGPMAGAGPDLATVAAVREALDPQFPVL